MVGLSVVCLLVVAEQSMTMMTLVTHLQIEIHMNSTKKMRALIAEFGEKEIHHHFLVTLLSFTMTYLSSMLNQITSLLRVLEISFLLLYCHRSNVETSKIITGEQLNERKKG